MRLVRRLALLASLISVLVAGCRARPVAGDACDPARRLCVDRSNGLFCDEGGKLAPVTCRGPRGCSGSDVTYDCDHRVATVGDACASFQELACASDGSAVLACDIDHAFVLRATCPGPEHCSFRDGWVACDDSTASEGDACVQPKVVACTTDRRGVVMCGEDRRFAPYASCRGPRGCALEDARVACDDSVADEGDLCARVGEVACSLDHGQALVCRPSPGITVAAGAFAAAYACPGGKGCVVRDGALECDGSPAQAGDACEYPGEIACTPEREAAVKCGSDHRFASYSSCRGVEKCAVRDGAAVCDASVAFAGDACVSPGELVCTLDGAAALQCSADHTFRAYAGCRGPRQCSGRGTKLACDDSILVAGEPCAHEGRVTCSLDGKETIVCRDGVSVSLSSCPQGCRLFDDELSCFGAVVKAGDPCFDGNQYAKAGRWWLACEGHSFHAKSVVYETAGAEWWLLRSSGRLARKEKR